MKVKEILFILVFRLIFHNTLQLKKKDQTSDIAMENGGDSDKIPILNVHMEEPDRDPIEVKRYEEERRIERNRIRDLEAREEIDKRAFQQVISLQTGQLAKLTNIAESTSNILKQLAAASPTTGTYSFVEKESNVEDKKEESDN